MPMVIHSSAAPPSEAPRYIERPAPIVFRESAEVPETQLHLELRTLLYQLLQDAFGEQVTVGSDQFVYLDASDPSACLAPDVYLGLAPPEGLVRTWKVWERGAPAVAVEIASDSDAPELSWQQKLHRYHRLGVTELVRFDPTTEKGALRIWHRVDGGLAEREVKSERARSLVLDLEWLVAPAERLPRVLRVLHHGKQVMTRREALAAATQTQQAEAEARQAAERRIQELEAVLLRRK